MNETAIPEDDAPGLRVLLRALALGPSGQLDGCRWQGESGARAAVVLRNGAEAEARKAELEAAGWAVEELRPVAGAALILAQGGGAAEGLPEAETALLAGAQVLMGQRFQETPEVVADWLGYHASHHGVSGAVVIDRAEGGQAAFALALERLLAARGVTLTVVIVYSSAPLGKPDEGPETHPFHAPDAPGKDRMEKPAPDPWLSALGEPLLYEALKWRFLARAKAVACLDVIDLIASGSGLFSLCERARTGVVMLVGRRIYPWRVRPGRAAAFSDHICRQFDARRGIARWACAPGKTGLANTWRLSRISYTRPDGNAACLFWRAMALRVEGESASKLAPKTSLVEDPALVELATGAFRGNPVRVPASQRREAAPEATKAGRTCIVTTMKNEGPFILEWIAFHRAIGVDDFLVYTNDCTDGTDTLLDLLQAKGYLQHRDNPFRAMNLKPQHAALQAAESEPLIQNAGWAICMDCDEFINVKLGNGTLPELYAAMGEANMIALTWRLFGNADVHGFEDRPILEQFTLCAPELVRKPHQAWGFKTLFRNIEIYRKLGVHRPKGLKPDLWDQVRWLNGSGKPLPREMFRNGWRSTPETYGYDWVQLNHYALRSAESFLVKRDRGRVNHVDRDQGLHYWFRMNHNAEEETSITRRLPLLRAEMARMLADPEIAAQHEACVAAHRAKIAELRARPEQAAFYDELTGPRLSALSRMLHLFGSAVFMEGPSAIPADFHANPRPMHADAPQGSEEPEP